MQPLFNRLRTKITSPDWAFNNLGKIPRLTLICLSTAGILLFALLISSVVLSLNPYRSAHAQVSHILVFYPDLESRLNYGYLAKSIFEQDLYPQVAQEIITWNGTLRQQEVDELAALVNSDSSTVYNFIQMMTLLSREVSIMDSLISKQQSPPLFTIALTRIRTSQELGAVDDLLQIHTGIPPSLQEMNAMRAQAQRIDPLMRQISEDMRIPQALREIQTQNPVVNESAALFGEGYWNWVNLPDRCASLEIQFVNNIAVLNEIYAPIDSARRIDRIWGFSLWQPAALWLQQKSTSIWVLIAILVIVASVNLYWQSNLRVKSTITGNNILHRLRTWSKSNLIKFLAQNRAENFYSQQSRIWAKRLRIQKQNRTVSRLPADGIGRLVVQSPDGSHKEISLPDKGIFRIGSDPGFAIYTSTNPQSYVEIWIHRAPRCYYLEVMFCDEPVLLNHQPVKMTRALKPGDLIQVQSLDIIFF
jgi:hypothetical protein